MARTKVDGNPFLDPAAPSLATVLAALETAEPDPRRRGEMASGIRTVCTVLGYSPHELPADTALLGRLIRKAMPAAAGVSPIPLGQCAQPPVGRPEGFRSRHHAGETAASPGAGLGGARGDAAATAGMLSRLMRWASAEGIDPEHLDQAAMERFGTALMQDSFHQNPRDCWRRTVVAWNAAVEGVSGWPQQRLTPPPGRERYVLALEAFPACVPGRRPGLARPARRQGGARCRADQAAPPGDDRQVALRAAPARLGPGGLGPRHREHHQARRSRDPRPRTPSCASISSAPATSPAPRPPRSPTTSRRSRGIMSACRLRSSTGCGAWLPGHAAGPGHDRQEPRRAPTVPERRDAEEAGPAPGNLVRSAAGQRAGGQAACDPPAAGACRRDPAGGADAAAEPLPARTRSSRPGAAPWSALALADHHPRRRGQERRADRAAPAGAQRPPARALPGPRPPCPRPAGRRLPVSRARRRQGRGDAGEPDPAAAASASSASG